MSTQSVVIGKEENWNAEVEKSEVPVLVDFWAPWCGPCRMVSPVIEEIAEKHKGQIKVVKVNVDDNEQLAMRYGIMSIPAIFLFNKGSIVSTQIGTAPAEVFENMLGAVVR